MRTPVSTKSKNDDDKSVDFSMFNTTPSLNQVSNESFQTSGLIQDESIEESPKKKPPAVEVEDVEESVLRYLFLPHGVTN